MLRLLMEPLSLASSADQFQPSLLLLLSEILSSMAAHQEGRKFLLLHTSYLLFPNDDSSSWPSLLFLFIQRFRCIPHVACGFLSFIRQLYRYEDGFESLRNHCPRELLGEVIEQNRAFLSSNSESSHFVHFGKDNLLQLAATSRGLHLLESTGLLGACVDAMFDRFGAGCWFQRRFRYAKDKSVGSLERYGYGTLISQLTCSTCGITALIRSGFLHIYAKEIEQCHDRSQLPINSLPVDDLDDWAHYIKSMGHLFKFVLTLPSVLV